MADRKKISPSTETELFSLSARRCCLCFGLNNDYNEKQGQIAHLNHDPSNSDLDNLAFLCLAHHDKYDSKTSQSKGYQIHEVKEYRTKLYKAVDDFRSSAYSDIKQKMASANNLVASETDIRQEIRKLLKHINPVVLDLVDKGEQTVPAMIGAPKLATLQSLTSNADFSDYLRIQVTGSMIIGGTNNRIGNFINDINEGFMQGIILIPTDKLREK